LAGCGARVNASTCASFGIGASRAERVDGAAQAAVGYRLNHRHTSELLDDLVARAPDGPVDLDWLLGHLDTRSFGLILLLLGLLVVIPGVATVATIVLLFPAAEMLLGRIGPTFPKFISKREFDFKRFKRFTARIRPSLVAIEAISKPRWNAHRSVTNRLVGLLVLVLAFTAMWPLPFVNVVPGILIAAIAVAYLQEDGLLLAVATAPALVWIASFAWTTWAGVVAVTRWMGL
jgi:hypothetical protein